MLNTDSILRSFNRMCSLVDIPPEAGLKFSTDISLKR